MSIYLRKSFSAGPIRLNFSNAGVGMSVGVRGVRFGISPTGKRYYRIGSNGIYAYETVGSKHSPEIIPDPKPESHIGFRSSSFDEVAVSLATALSRPRFDVIATIISFCVGILLAVEIPWILAVYVPLVILGLILLINNEHNQRITTLDYRFSEEGKEVFREIANTINTLTTCETLEAVVKYTEITSTTEWKRNAGATILTKSVPCAVGHWVPPWAQVNIEIPSIKCSLSNIYFFPEGIIVDRHGEVKQYQYKEMSISVQHFIMIVREPPRDTHIVGNTWEHPNKKGGPDHRFKINREMFECQYGSVTISCPGFSMDLNMSRRQTANEFEKSWKNVKITA
jgi:hypothetical protein